MRNYNMWLAAGIVAGVAWFAWLLLVSNRYQTLCQVHYWNATQSELASCNDMRNGLEGK